jgi:hypothetical protein
MTNARSQQQAKYPIPFFKLHGKMLRFDRKKIQQWLHDIANMTPTFRLPKQQKRGRKPKVQ